MEPNTCDETLSHIRSWISCETRSPRRSTPKLAYSPREKVLSFERGTQTDINSNVHPVETSAKSEILEETKRLNGELVSEEISLHVNHVTCWWRSALPGVKTSDFHRPSLFLPPHPYFKISHFLLWETAEYATSALMSHGAPKFISAVPNNQSPVIGSSSAGEVRLT